ncbi:hypothetical protein D6V68_20790 [Escherichia albertii]|nr:hypothetical protein [Escherichia albertii]EEW7499025.1 hypothetical protein [Escherichia albertii]EFO0111437.1 hypothetical protein [Escherichia albertii]MLY53589.1 hypothetical protein [Escherichia albertii]
MGFEGATVRKRTILDTKTTVVPPFWRFLKAIWLKNSLNVVCFPNSRRLPVRQLPYRSSIEI